MKKISPRLAAVVLSLSVAACASPAVVASSGIQHTGRDSYTVYVAMKGSVNTREDNSSKTRERAISDANAFCAKQGLGQAYIIQEQVHKDAAAAAVINFSCGG